MKASSAWVGDVIRYRGFRYRIHGIIKLHHPSRIRILTGPLGSPWKEIPGHHTVIWENERLR